MSAPRTKRQFAGAASDPAQRQITSFFSKSSDSPGGIDDAPSRTIAPPLSPPIPAQVQANLLSVGMRVRKSVPEGYKTGTSCSGFSLWADTSASGDQGFPLPTGAASDVSALSSRRELLPFCGIHKVGGLGVQPDPPARRPAISMPTPSYSAPELDDVPSLTSSQDSINSTTSEPSPPQQPTLLAKNTRKRLYTEDTSGRTVPGAGNPIIWRDRRDWLDGEVSPRSLAPAGWEKNARVMAVPKGVRKTVSVSRLSDLGQENALVDVASCADDFGEAEFLDRRLGEGEMEVEFE